MVSIKDIAKALSISPSSVSLVLNGKAKEKRISEALAERIKTVAAEMGYQPNRAAVSLRTGRSGTIGLIVENITSHFFGALAHTIEAEARRLRYNVLYCSAENDAEKGKEVLRLMLNQQVDGYIIVPGVGMEQEIENLLKSRKPLVLMDRCLPGVEAPYVMVDNYGGMRQGVEYLLKKGNHRIGFVTVDIDLPQMQERQRAYEDELTKAGIKLETGHVLKLAYTEEREAAIKGITTYLQANRDLDAVVFATNYLGVYGLMALRNLGLSLPADLKILCFDDHDIFELYQPSVTVVRQPVREIAHTAMQLLSAELGYSDSITNTKVLIKPELVVRESV